jgi:hypothetical protein
LRRLALAVGGLSLIPCSAAVAAVAQGGTVSSNAVDGLPQLVATSTVGHPHVDAITTLGDTGFAAGLFDRVTQGGSTYSGLDDIVSFSISGKSVRTAFRPAVSGGQIWSLAADPSTNSVYIAGDFTTVDGVARSGLAKLNATTGAVDPAFRPYFSVGKVKQIQLVTMAGRQRLVVGGGMPKKLASVDPATGKNDGFIGSAIQDAVPGAWGGVSVYHFAIDPSHTHLAATGNFMTVDGQPRKKFFMLNLSTASVPFGTKGATLSSWFYPGLAKDCSATKSGDARRIANLEGIDWSPDGRYFDITATGKIPAQTSDVYHDWMTVAQKSQTTVCDAVGRFSLADDTRPQWINYTGGDSVWVVQDTGSAVYIQGHFKWVDNPDGYGSLGIGDKTSGAPASQRSGIAAISPTSGKAIASWHPAVPTVMGGKALLATSSGLWVGSDSPKFGAEPHYGLAFAPLP